jgi:hypothetical protein
MQLSISILELEVGIVGTWKLEVIGDKLQLRLETWSQD